MPAAPFFHAGINAVSPMRLRESTAAPAASAPLIAPSSPLLAAASNCWLRVASPAALLTDDSAPNAPTSMAALAKNLAVLFITTSKRAASVAWRRVQGRQRYWRLAI